MTKIVPPDEESFGPDKNELDFFHASGPCTRKEGRKLYRKFKGYIYISEFEEVIAKKTGLQKKR